MTIELVFVLNVARAPWQEIAGAVIRVRPSKSAIHTNGLHRADRGPKGPPGVLPATSTVAPLATTVVQVPLATSDPAAAAKAAAERALGTSTASETLPASEVASAEPQSAEPSQADDSAAAAVEHTAAGQAAVDGAHKDSVGAGTASEAPAEGEEQAVQAEAPCNGHASASVKAGDVLPEAAPLAEPEPVPGMRCLFPCLPKMTPQLLSEAWCSTWCDFRGYQAGRLGSRAQGDSAS